MLLLAVAVAIAAGGVATAVAVVIVSCLMIPAAADDRSYGCSKRGGEVGVRRYGRRGGAHFVSQRRWQKRLSLRMSQLDGVHLRRPLQAREFGLGLERQPEDLRRRQ